MRSVLKPEVRFAAPAELLERGCVNAIGLDEIRSKAGLRWEKMRPSIWTRMEGLLHQKLGPVDFYARLDDTTFLVSTPSVSPSEAQILCLRIAQELHTSMLGFCDLSQVRISRASALDGDDIDLQQVSASTLAKLARSAGLGGFRGEPQDSELQPAKPTFRPDALNVAHEYRFAPMWDAQKEAVTTFRCVTMDGRDAFDGAMSGPQFRADIAAMLARLRHATASLASSLESGQRFLMSIPISYELLGSPIMRSEITTIFQAASSELRPYLLFEICNLPQGVPQSRLSDLIVALRPFCRGVSAQFPARIPSYSMYQGSGLHAISLSLAANPGQPAEPSSEKACEQRIYDLCAAARRLHVMSVVHDISDFKLLLYARDVGVNVVSGSLIGPPQNRPGPLKRLSVREIASIAMAQA